MCSTGKLRSLEEQYSSVVLTVHEQKQLIAQLEEDLRSVNALSTMFRPDAEGEASVTSSSAEFVADAVRELNVGEVFDGQGIEARPIRAFGGLTEMPCVEREADRGFVRRAR